MQEPPQPLNIPPMLSASERLMLAQQLLDSVLAEALPLSQAQIAEVRSRAASLDDGLSIAESWAAVRARLLASE